MASRRLFSTKTEPLYQKDGHLYTHSAPISSVQPLSSLPADTQGLFKAAADGEPYVVTTGRTIFHAQGGGQPSDTGTISHRGVVFKVQQVRRVERAILHMGTFGGGERFAAGVTGEGEKEKEKEEEEKEEEEKEEEEAHQSIDIQKRILHSRIHTAGHILGLAAAALKNEGTLPADLADGKASHYPGAAFVEFTGLIPTDRKPALQAKTDELVAQDLPVRIHFWDEARARAQCTGVLDSFKQDDDGVRVVQIGDAGCYPCGGTHVRRTGECGRVAVRNVKRQKGVTKVSYEVQDV